MGDMTQEHEGGETRLGTSQEAEMSLDHAAASTREALKGHLGPDQRNFYDGLLENLNGARAFLSKKSLAATSSLLLAVTFLTSCAPAVIGPIIIDGGGTGPTATETSVPPTVTPTETATPTEAPKIEEHDLNPIFTEEINQEFMGVQIHSELITDESLSGTINAEQINNKTNWAEYIARTIFKTWWRNGDIKHTSQPTEDDFKAYMPLWSEAQKGDDPNLWKQVEFSIYANDLNDGNGYIQEQVIVWPMYSGDAPVGVRGIQKMDIAVVSGGMVKNITMTVEEVNEGFGTNIDGSTLTVYTSVTYPSLTPKYNFPKNTAEGFASVSSWLVRNPGTPFTGYISMDSYLAKLLLKGGLTVR